MPGNKPDRKKAKSKPALGDRDHKDDAERDLEALVFGGDASDMWDKAGHELSDNEDDDNQVFEDDAVTKEDGDDQVWPVFRVSHTCA